MKTWLEWTINLSKMNVLKIILLSWLLPSTRISQNQKLLSFHTLHLRQVQLIITSNEIESSKPRSQKPRNNTTQKCIYKDKTINLWNWVKLTQKQNHMELHFTRTNYKDQRGRRERHLLDCGESDHGGSEREVKGKNQSQRQGWSNRRLW